MDMDVRERVVELLFIALQEGGCEQVAIDLQTPLAELGLDSLKLVEIVYELEREFAIETDEELLAQLESVGDVVVMVESARHGAERCR